MDPTGQMFVDFNMFDTKETPYSTQFGTKWSHNALFFWNPNQTKLIHRRDYFNKKND